MPGPGVSVVEVGSTPTPSLPVPCGARCGCAPEATAMEMFYEPEVTVMPEPIEALAAAIDEALSTP